MAETDAEFLNRMLAPGPENDSKTGFLRRLLRNGEDETDVEFLKSSPREKPAGKIQEIISEKVLKHGILKKKVHSSVGIHLPGSYGWNKRNFWLYESSITWSADTFGVWEPKEGAKIKLMKIKLIDRNGIILRLTTDKRRYKIKARSQGEANSWHTAIQTAICSLRKSKGLCPDDWEHHYDDDAERDEEWEEDFSHECGSIESDVDDEGPGWTRESPQAEAGRGLLIGVLSSWVRDDDHGYDDHSNGHVDGQVNSGGGGDLWAGGGGGAIGGGHRQE